MGTEADPADIATKALERAKELAEETGKPFTLIVDTAGRQVINQ
jgi:signal recognition particle GTPase